MSSLNSIHFLNSYLPITKNRIKIYKELIFLKKHKKSTKKAQKKHKKSTNKAQIKYLGVDSI